MQNIGLGFVDHSDGATFDGAYGSWIAAAPISDLADPEEGPARSTNATTGSTKFRADLSSAKNIRVVILYEHNLSSAATVKVSIGSSAGGTQSYAGSFVTAWPFTPLVFNGRHHAFMVILPATVSARHVQVEISDTGNSAGYVELRCWIGDLIQTEWNAQYGLKHGFKELTAKSYTTDGHLGVNAKRNYRTVSFVLPWVSLTEGDPLHEYVRVAGTGNRIAYVEDPSSASISQQYGFIGTLDKMSEFEYSRYRNYGVGFEMTEG